MDNGLSSTQWKIAASIMSDSMNSPSQASPSEARRVPCKARGIKNHCASTAFIEIPNDAPHGMILVCSHPACASSQSRRFRYCAVCKEPVTKKNFTMRHNHALLLKNTSNGRFLFPSDHDLAEKKRRHPEVNEESHNQSISTPINCRATKKTTTSSLSFLFGRSNHLGGVLSTGGNFTEAAAKMKTNHSSDLKIPNIGFMDSSPDLSSGYGGTFCRATKRQKLYRDHHMEPRAPLLHDLHSSSTPSSLRRNSSLLASEIFFEEEERMAINTISPGSAAGDSPAGDRASSSRSVLFDLFLASQRGEQIHQQVNGNTASHISGAARRHSLCGPHEDDDEEELLHHDDGDDYDKANILAAAGSRGGIGIPVLPYISDDEDDIFTPLPTTTTMSRHSSEGKNSGILPLGSPAATSNTTPGRARAATNVAAKRIEGKVDATTTSAPPTKGAAASSTMSQKQAPLCALVTEKEELKWLELFRKRPRINDGTFQQVWLDKVIHHALPVAAGLASMVDGTDTPPEQQEGMRHPQSEEGLNDVSCDNVEGDGEDEEAWF